MRGEAGLKGRERVKSPLRARPATDARSPAGSLSSFQAPIGAVGGGLSMNPAPPYQHSL